MICVDFEGVLQEFYDIIQRAGRLSIVSQHYHIVCYTRCIILSAKLFGTEILSVHIVVTSQSIVWFCVLFVSLGINIDMTCLVFTMIVNSIMRLHMLNTWSLILLFWFVGSVYDNRFKHLLCSNYVNNDLLAVRL